MHTSLLIGSYEEAVSDGIKCDLLRLHPAQSLAAFYLNQSRFVREKGRK